MKNALFLFLILISFSQCESMKHHPTEKMVDVLITRPDKIDNSFFKKANPSSVYFLNSIEEWKRYFKSYNGEYDLLAYPLNKHFNYHRYFEEFFDKEGSRICKIKILHKTAGYGAIFYFRKIGIKWVYNDIQFFGTVETSSSF